jgi:hypothetical protein
MQTIEYSAGGIILQNRKVIIVYETIRPSPRTSIPNKRSYVTKPKDSLYTTVKS